MIHADLWRKLCELAPEDVCRRAMAQALDDGKGYRLPVLGRPCRVNLVSRSVAVGASPGTGERPSFHLHLSSVNDLIRAQDVPLAGEWIGERQFPAGPLFFRGPHEMPTQKLRARFGDDRDGLEAAGLSLGGHAVAHGDAAVELPLFPRVPVRVVLWLRDEEFPARVHFLFDRTANQHLLLDGLWSAAHVVSDALLGACPG